METSTDKCNVCGGNETKLIDGYYYCIECGTQNTNVRETIVDDQLLANGTFAYTYKKKTIKIHKEGIEMSGEWYKWHAFNFIISGLADELISLGAKSTFKTKLLWIWTRYIKKYQNKSELMSNKTTLDENNETILPSFMAEEIRNSVEETHEECKIKINRFDIVDGSKRDIKSLSRGVIVAMLYLSLNLDESDIQLSDLYRFLIEKHIDISNVKRFVPDDVNVKKIPNWINFQCSKLGTQHQIRTLAVSLLRKLDLGTPKIPDLRKIVDRFLSELSLPDDIKPFIYSLIHFRGCNYLDVDKTTQKCLIRLPDYEGTVMAFIVLALKICFGLDCDYEVRLSNAVEKINVESNFPKSYKISKYSDLSDRLFSFREWCSYIQFRKFMLAKHNLRIAAKHFLDIDDYVYLEHMEKRPKNKEELTDKISMEIISKLCQEDPVNVIPKESFLPTLTPMSDYTDVVIDYYRDPEIKKPLSEDFKRYSLKYACEKLSFFDPNFEGIIKGVSEERKTESNIILGTIVTKKAKRKMVYVKNCENQNWMITNPPTIEHVTTIEVEDQQNDKESDHGYDSECTPKEKEADSVINHIVSESDINQTLRNESICENKITKETKRREIIEEEDSDENIYDDCFEDITFKEECERNNFDDNHANENGDKGDQVQNDNDPDEDFDRRSNISDDSFVPTFNPDTFNRDNAIKELILFACKKYKIPIPAEYRSKEHRKRKQAVFGNDLGSGKTNKRAKYDGKNTVEHILTNYHNYVQSDFVTKLQQEVNLAIRNNNDLSNTNLQDNFVESGLAEQDGLKSPIVQSMVNNSNNFQQSDIHVNNKTDIIDKNVENALFEGDKEMNFDDLISKGDPKFNAELYDINQLYIKVKDTHPDECFDVENDPEINKILFKDILEGDHSMKSIPIKPKPKENFVINKDESDSEDEKPLSVIRDEIILIKEMYRQEENYERLIKNEEIPEFKYWVRHYDRDFMDKSKDWHMKFNEELKENVPSSFYFVLQECASILNCTYFYLYKQLQILEEYFICKSKRLDFKVQDAIKTLSQDSENADRL